MARIRTSLIPIAWITVLLVVIYAGCSSNDNGGTNPPGPKTGTLNISSTPTGASISIDGTAETDTTPATFAEVDSGNHTIALSKDGYDDWDSTVHVPAGGTANASTELVLTMYSLNLFVVGDGVVHKDPNSTLYLPGTEVEILAEPSLGWEFSGWTGQYASDKNPDTVTMTQDWTSTAVFTEVNPVWDSIRVEGNASALAATLVSPIAFLDTSLTDTIQIYDHAGWPGDAATGDFIIQFDPMNPTYSGPADSIFVIVTAWDDLNENLALEYGEPIGWWDRDGNGIWGGDLGDYIWLHRGDTVTNVTITKFNVATSASSGKVVLGRVIVK